MKVNLIAHTPNPEQLVAAAAKLCYSDCSIDSLFDFLTPEKTAAFLTKLNNLGHASPLEHVTFTFAIQGVSRALLAQITRHRLASFSVQSQRYNHLGLSDSGSGYIKPNSVANFPELSAAFDKWAQKNQQDYQALHEILKQKFTSELIRKGCSEQEAAQKAEKMANEDARSILPNACETRFIVTMNARELNHFFSLRCCNRAQDEIHSLANEMLRLVYPVAPNLFAKSGPGCVSSGHCTEGSMSCGKSSKVRSDYESLKKGAAK